MRHFQFTSLVFALLLNVAVAPVAFGEKSMKEINAAVGTARQATKEGRYADAESLMLQVVAEQPKLVIPRVELGLAQLGLKKYSDAENEFKFALGIDTASNERAEGDKFFQQTADPTAVAPTATRTNRNSLTREVNDGQSKPPELLGTCYASLGEIYIHQGKVAEAQKAFDIAARSNPTQAGVYFENEAIFFFQAGNAEAQLAAADKAIAADPKRPAPYYFKGQGLTGKATIDSKTQKLALPPGCADAYRKYLELAPSGPYSADAKGILAGAA